MRKQITIICLTTQVTEKRVHFVLKIMSTFSDVNRKYVKLEYDSHDEQHFREGLRNS